MERLRDRVALVTGGSSGIGRAAALTFAGEGARVVIAARDTERGEQVAREIENTGGEAMFVKADVATTSDVEALVERAVQAYGRLDCAFNNAASSEGNFRPTADFEEEEFDRAVSINLKGVWSCMKYEIRQMLRQEPAGGAIVNTSSVNGLGERRKERSTRRPRAVCFRSPNRRRRSTRREASGSTRSWREPFEHRCSKACSKRFRAAILGKPRNATRL